MGLRNTARVIGGAGVLLALIGSPSYGQQIPEVFHGVWITSVADPSTCKATDWDRHENDGLMQVTARAAQFWETHCSVKRNPRTLAEDGTSADLTFACGGEGEISSAREIWSVVDIGSRRALVMTQLEASASVPADSKKPNPLRRSLGSRLYLACDKD